MITDDHFTAYYQNLATLNRQLLHDVDGKRSFFVVEDADNLDNFDEALRAVNVDTMMLLVSEECELDDNESENHVQEVDLQVYILQRKRPGVSVSAIRAECLQILRDILGRTKSDARKNKVVEGKLINFRISNIPVRKVGPIFLEWYGYTAILRFGCPFGYSVDARTWTDI